MNNEITEMILEHIKTRIARMKQGEETDCEGLIDPGVWEVTPPSERRYVFGRCISMLVTQGRVPLELARFTSNRHNLYRKI